MGASFVKVLRVVLPVVVAGVSFSNVAAGEEPLGGINGTTLGREPQLRPGALGNGTLNGLQYADPAEGLVVMDTPEANNQGGTEVSHPLLIPRGRGGFQPELNLTYDSAGGNGWVGNGWDLSVGAIEVDTRWGVPRYDPNKESETYLLDGAVLSPTAVRASWQDRVAERSDFTHRIEGDYELIIRHGTSPKDYWWEVRDKMGGIRWYGGYPDSGGPNVDTKATCPPDEPDCPTPYQSLERDPSAILSDANGNAYRWALSAQRDVGVNMIRYFYETVDGTRVGAEQKTTGKQLYLTKIRYTAGAAAAGGFTEPEDPAYEVRFLRDGAITPAPTPRKDIVVSARGGFLEVTSDLLRRVEVWHGAPNGGQERNYNELSRRYDLEYTVGAFGKTLLSGVDQVGSDGVVYGRHTFDYYDEVRGADGAYNGFSTETPWSTVDDRLSGQLLTPVELSSLGASETNAGDVHLYLGFNPLTPLKTGSFGGAVTISGGATEALAEMIDINGDLLPDKVFREQRGGPIFYRLNTSGPDRNPTFGERGTVGNLSKLSTEFNVGLAGGAEAYLGLTGQFTVSSQVTVGEDYFTDANGDGLPDFVSAGTVYFNHLDPSTGNPTFDTSSALTDVPITTSTATLPAIQALQDLETQRREQSPLQDTVRRWVAPFNGTIAIAGDPELDPPTAPGDPVPAYTGDGVSVAIQHNGSRLWTATLTTPGATATPTGVGALAVSKGDRIYFRVQSIDDGARDQVDWNPTITYTGSPSADVNGLSQKTFVAADDFTLAGRPGTVGIMPLQGTVRFEATLKKTKATTDDVTVLVLKNGTPVFTQLVTASTVNAGGIPLTGSFDVAAPTDTAQDKVEVRIAADSPIDVNALDLDHRLFYTAATDPSGNPVDVGTSANPTMVLRVPADTDVYPENTLSAPREPWTSDIGRSVTARASLNVAANSGDGDVFVTVKTSAGTVAKQKIAVANSASAQTASVEFPLDVTNGTQYWFDFSIRDPDLADKSSGQAVQLRWTEDTTTTTRDVPSVLNSTGRQGTFPLPYRGWGYAGYNGDGDRANQAINEADFTIDPADFPTNPTKPTGFNDPNYKDPSRGNSFVFNPTVLDITNAAGAVVATLPAWRGMKDNILGGATSIRSSRSGADNPSLGVAPGSGVSAVRRVGVAAPVFSLTGGIGPLNATFGAGPSFGLLDYSDLNGDGFPDIVAPGYVKYTNPRGAFLEDGGGVTVVNQDTTFAVAGGLGGSPVEIKSDAQGDTNSAQNTAPVSGTGAKPTNTSAAGTGESAAESQYGFNVGGSIGISASFTNPNAADPEWSDELDQMPGIDRTAPLEQELADVNGDGLPDRVLATPQGVFVRLNLGYSFSTEEIRWSGGGFENNESYAGSVGASLGFTTPNREFSGGAGLSESIDISRYSWVDIDGDGILDRLHKNDPQNRVEVAFGTNSGLLDDVVYGSVAEGTFELIGAKIPVGQQISTGRSRGLGGGFDFTVGIGPLCVVVAACYIIVNPGAHFDHSISTTQIQMIDVDGDGYPDSVKSEADNELKVRFNNRGKTNLLRSVTNPFGGSFRLGYTRDGNTVANATSLWTLSSVEVDDGRTGDGEDVRLSTFEYTGAKFNKVERENLGYSSVIERQRAFKNDGDVSDDPLLRTIERTYLNNTVFDAGLLTSVVVKKPDGAKLQETTASWQMIDIATNTSANLAPTTADPANLRLLTMSVAARRTRVDQRWYATDGTVGEETWSTFEYDRLGNVVRQVDVGEPEIASDDVIATMVYTTCENASDPDNYHSTHLPGGGRQSCPLPAMPGGTPPFWSNTACPTWTSLPAVITITDGSGRVLRKRDGAPSLCDNSSVTDLREYYGSGPDDFAQSLLSYDEWGSYSHIEYPENAAGERQVVDYVYDDDSHANIANTTDAHGLQATAEFDGRTGRIASRTDANGQVTSYTYDPFGRIETITGPYEQGTGRATVRFEYFTGAPGYAYAVAHHFDVQNPSDPIDTATFVDGTGRQTQTKRDASIFGGATQTPTAAMVVSGATSYDGLGRPTTERYPTSEPTGTIGVYNASTAGLATALEWNLLDQPTRSTTPDGATTVTDYSFGGSADFGATVFRMSVVDAEGKPQASWADVHDNVLAVDDEAIGKPTIRTRYTYDPLGQLLTVRDNAGNVTTHTYDLMGRRLSTSTPDGGLVEYRNDGAGNLTSLVTPKLRAAGQAISYEYDIDRLIGVDYPGTDTPDVTYTYGGPGAAGNGGGRVIRVEDGARTQQLTYDRLGQVATEVAVMNLHNGPSAPLQTSFIRDGFGRLQTVTYPDGEVLTHSYDSGGLLRSLRGTKGSITTDYLKRREYDEFQYRRFDVLGNDVSTEYTYDAQTRRLSRQVTKTPSRTIQDLNYGYDKVGNVKTMDNREPTPATNLKGGKSTQTYTYDPYYRIATATGTAPLAPRGTRDYTYTVTYDAAGNVETKTQRDTVAGRVQTDTTYSFAPVYSATKPHQIATLGGNTYTYDADGNLTRIADSRNRTVRALTWDAADRLRVADDSSSSTAYLYDSAGELGVQRGPQGERAFVNRWYHTINGGPYWKQIWADGDRIAQATEQLDDLGNLVALRYYQHEDLQGSTNVVTDTTGGVFEHLEYFPSGEIWIQENSTTHRTPYRFNGAYNDEVRNLNNLGQRWYEPRQQIALSPEPLLTDDPMAVVGDPALVPAYTYAEANPLRLRDLDGRKPTSANGPPVSRFSPQDALLAQYTAKGGSRLWRSLVSYAVSDRAERDAAFTDRFEINALLTINLTRGDDGHRLESIEAGILGFSKTLMEAKTAQSTTGKSSGAPQVALGTTNAAPAPNASNPTPGATAGPQTNALANVGNNAGPPAAATGSRPPNRPPPPVPSRPPNRPPPPVPARAVGAAQPGIANPATPSASP